MRLHIDPEAQEHYEMLEVDQKAAVLKVVERLKKWPEVSGVELLHGEWAGHKKIRTGDWRVIFKIEHGAIVVVRFMDRKENYR